MLQTVAHQAMASNQSSVRTGFKIDVSREERIGRVSSEWFSWPNDELRLPPAPPVSRAGWEGVKQSRSEAG
jgi:hypothetical protein